MRATRALVCLALVAAACGANPQSPRTGSGDKLYEAVVSGATQSLAVIDSRSHSADRKLSLGVPSPDWKHVYTTVANSLVDTDPRTGNTVNTLQLHDAYQLPPATANGLPGGLSPDGRWLVVERFEGPQAEPTATHMLLIDTAAMRIVHRADLKGYFAFDAINDEGTNLYLIQHLTGREYYVRLYDVGAAALAVRSPRPRMAYLAVAQLGWVAAGLSTHFRAGFAATAAIRAFSHVPWFGNASNTPYWPSSGCHGSLMLP